MILHFFLDEKVVDKIIGNFERVAPDQNIYCTYSGNDRDLKFIKVHAGKIIRFHTGNDINEFLDSNNVRSIICHLLTSDIADVVLKIKKDIKIFWVIWGYDVYSLPRIRPTLYAPLTRKFLVEHKKLIRLDWMIKKNKIARSIFYLLAGKKNSFRLLENAHRKVTYCTTYLKEDFDLFLNFYPNQKIKFLHAAFQTIDQYIGNVGNDAKINGSNILIGNSNSAECNHLDVLNFLHKHDIGEAKVYVPLSYGNDEKYKRAVIALGEHLLKKQFVPLLEFMQFDEYIRIQLSCSTGIFYHYRQQAMGNIIAMLWLGARLYFHHSNPAFKYLKRVGIKVFDLDLEFGQYKSTTMIQSDVENNKNILSAIFSEQQVMENYQNLVKEALQ